MDRGRGEPRCLCAGAHVEGGNRGQQRCPPMSRRRAGPTPPASRSARSHVTGLGRVGWRRKEGVVGRRCCSCHLMKGRNPRLGLCRPRTGEGVTMVGSDDEGGERRRHYRARPRRDAGDGRVGKETRSIGKEGEKPGSQTHIFDWAATQRKL